MPKKARELSAIEVKRLAKKKGRHAVGGVSGLLLNVTASGAASWILRFATGETRISANGKPFSVNRDLGLGGYPDVSLADARELAREARLKLTQGIDPVSEKKALRQARLAEMQRLLTFEQAAREVIRVKQAEAKNLKHAQQWENTLITYAFPFLGKMAVSEIQLAHITSALRPIWETKTETATRVRQRIEKVLDWAAAHGHREGENPARWKGNLENVLPNPSKISKKEHHRALSIDDAPAFLQELSTRTGNAAACLKFVILTATRSSEARLATWSEIDLENRLWIIPADRMKAGREHRVPLSDAALEVLQAMPSRTGLIFPSTSGKALSDVGVSKVVQRMGYHEKTTVHGFRSTFRDWAAERTSTPQHVAEMALAHSIGNAVEAAYRRGDLLAKRFKLMQQWADYLTQQQAPATVHQLKVETKVHEA